MDSINYEKKLKKEDEDLTNVNKLAKSLESNHLSKKSDAEIEKILILFSDNSFEIYNDKR